MSIVFFIFIAFVMPVSALTAEKYDDSTADEEKPALEDSNDGSTADEEKPAKDDDSTADDE